MKFLWIIVLFCCAYGFFHGAILVQFATSAPQQAAAAAMGIAWAVIPYCFVKAISMMIPREVIVKTDNK